MKTTKQYIEMTNDEKAQAIYDFMKTNPKVTIGDKSISLDNLLMNLSNDYDTDTIFTVEDWLDYEADSDLYDLLKTAQWSKELNINKKYIRKSIFYSGYKIANSVLELVDEDEAVDWIGQALNENNITVGQLNNLMEENE